MAPLHQRECQHPAPVRDLLVCKLVSKWRLQHNRRVNVAVLSVSRAFRAKAFEAPDATGVSSEVVGIG
jgi:hypothetical protein